jgi:flagellar protein FliS
MSYEQNTNAYLKNAILSTSREQLVPLLYEHLLVSLRRASKQLSSRDIEGKAASIDKASAILYELLGSLDFEAQDEMASRLASLYTYFLQEVGDASRHLDGKRLDPLIEMVFSLHESWVEAARLVSGDQETEEARSTA